MVKKNSSSSINESELNLLGFFTSNTQAVVNLLFQRAEEELNEIYPSISIANLMEADQSGFYGIYNSIYVYDKNIYSSILVKNTLFNQLNNDFVKHVLTNDSSFNIYITQNAFMSEKNKEISFFLLIFSFILDPRRFNNHLNEHYYFWSETSTHSSILIYASVGNKFKKYFFNNYAGDGFRSNIETKKMLGLLQSNLNILIHLQKSERFSFYKNIFCLNEARRHHIYSCIKIIERDLFNSNLTVEDFERIYI